MKRPRKATMIILGILVALYLYTLIGGWVSHSTELSARAWQMWRRGQATEQRWRAQGPPYAGRTVVSPGGPHSSVHWCVPLLPGVLLVNSFYVVGPLWGRGGVKLVAFYGVGSMELLTLFGWVS